MLILLNIMKSAKMSHIQAPLFYIGRDFSYTPLKFRPQRINPEQHHKHLVQVQVAARDHHPLFILDQTGPKITAKSTVRAHELQ